MNGVVEKAFYDELEKISSFGLKAGLGTAAVGGSLSHLYGKADDRQDRLLLQTGHITPEELVRRRSSRLKNSLLLGALAGVGGGVGASKLQKSVAESIKSAVKPAVEEAVATAKKETRDLMSKQVDYASDKIVRGAFWKAFKPAVR